MSDPKPPQSWVERNADLFFGMLIGVCAMLTFSEFMYEHHPHFTIERIPEFFELFGFAAFIFIVFAGKALRRLIMRNEDYYDRR
jgi:hypothetical protein